MSTFQQFSFGERLGVSFVVQSSILTTLSVTIILAYALYKWSSQTLRSRNEASASNSSLFINLMVADLIQALGNFPSIRWIADAGVTEGHLCTAQAALKQVGINGVALTTMAIALHTFVILILRWRTPRHTSKFVVLGIWIFTGFVVGIPNAVHRNVVYYGHSKGGYWCWILNKYKTEQIVTEYLWVWSTAVLLIILYGIMFLVMHGYIIIDDDEGVHWYSNLRAHLDLSAVEGEENRKTKAIAKMMLFYPAVYIGCVLPNTFARWLYFSGHTIPYQFTLFANALFSLSGCFNLFLFFFTRPEMVIGQVQPEYPSTASNNPNPRQEIARHTHPSTYGHIPDRVIDEEQTGNSPDFDPTSLLPNQSMTSCQSPVPGGLVSRPSSGHEGGDAGYFPGAYSMSPRSQDSLAFDDRPPVGNVGGGMGYPPTGLRNDNLMHGQSNSFQEEEDYGRLPG